MYILLSLLSASLDSFVCGFLMQGLGIGRRKKDFCTFFLVMFGCCFTACAAGKALSAFTSIERYLSYLGFVIMLFLSYCTLKDIDQTEQLNKDTSVGLLALSLAADSSVVSIYLGLCNLSALQVGLYSSILSCFLIYVGLFISSKLIKSKIQNHTKLFSGIIFLLLAFYKLYHALLV